MKRNKLKDGTVLYRGTSLEALGLSGDVRKIPSEEIKNLVDKEYSDKGFMSTSKDEMSARNFSNRSSNSYGKVMFIIKTKGKKTGVDVGENSVYRDKEKEVILPRNAKLKITDAKRRLGNLTIYAEY